MINKTKITVVGSGYVGMSLAVLFAQHNEVVVLDIDANRVDKINNNLDSDDNTFSFSEWISIIQTKKIDRSNKKNNTELVDLFLENKPSISKNSKQKWYYFNS